MFDKIVSRQAQKNKNPIESDSEFYEEESLAKIFDPQMMRRIKEDFSLEMLLEKSNPLLEKYYDLTRNLDKDFSMNPNPEQKQQI